MVLLFNLHTGGVVNILTENVNSIAKYQNKLIMLKNDGIYLADYESNPASETIIKTGFIDLGAIYYNTDAVLYREPKVEVTMIIEDKDGLSVEYIFPENVEKINLGKGHEGRFFRITLKTRNRTFIKELLINYNKVDTFG